MRRLTRNLRSHARNINRDDDGVTLVFVAVSLIALLALSAFAVDFGRMYEERRQLQNGADAAAVAIAEDCARGLCDGSYDEYAVAETYVDSNARDGSANAWLVELDLTEQTVTVHNRTEDPGGDHKYDMLLAGAVGFDGFTVGAEATVAWGLSGDPLTTIPLIISECEWQKFYPEGPGGILPVPTDGSPPGANLFPDPADSLPWEEEYPLWYTNLGIPGYPKPTTLTFHDAQVTSTCSAVAGQDVSDIVGDENQLNGGFGWLEVTDTVSCEAATYGVDNDWAAASPGNGGPPPACDSILESLLLADSVNGTTVKIPYFDAIWRKNDPDHDPVSPCLGASGPDGKCYHISGYGLFHVVGYKLSSGSGQSNFIFPKPVEPPLKANGQPWPEGQWVSKFDCVPANPGSDEVCLLGYFVTGVDNDGTGTIGGGGRGITVIKFTS